MIPWGPLSLQNQQGAGHQDYQVSEGAPSSATTENHQALAQAEGNVFRICPH